MEKHDELKSLFEQFTTQGLADQRTELIIAGTSPALPPKTQNTCDIECCQETAGTGDPCTLTAGDIPDDDPGPDYCV